MTEDKIEKLLKSGNKLSAIQVLVKEEGLSLKEAKDYTERYLMEYGMDQVAINQNDEPLKKQDEASWLLIFVIYAFVFLIIIFITAPIICSNTKVLQGFSGVCFWLFLHGWMILAAFIASVCFLWRLIKAQHKLKKIGGFLVCLLGLFLFIDANGAEAVKAAKDIVSEPVEVSFADYDVMNVSMTTGRSGSSRICYRVVLENNRGEGVDSILMPRNSMRNIPARMEPDIDAMRKEQGTITVFVYPNTGIAANRESLNMLSKNIIY